MSEHPVVGPLFSSHVIEEAVLAKLRRWLPGYLTIACDLHGVNGKIAGVRSWAVANTAEKWPEQGLPALLVVGPEESSEVEASGQGMYRATWPVEVGLVIAARTGPNARKYARIYGAAIRGALLQGRSQGEEGLTTTWRGEGNGILGLDQKRRTMAANANLFDVTVDNVVSWRMGPGSNKPPIPSDWPEVTETEVEEEITE
jgi:hypothetical protein